MANLLSQAARWEEKHEIMVWGGAIYRSVPLGLNVLF